MTLLDLHENEESHDWQFSGETSDESGNYGKWVCPCGAMKIQRIAVVADDSGTFSNTPATGSGR